MSGAERRGSAPGDSEQSEDTPALWSIRLEQLQHTRIVTSGLTGQVPGDEVREVADLCVNCKMCGVECPSRVQIPRMMLQAKAANVARHGLDRADWVLARMESMPRAVAGTARVSGSAW